MQDRAYKSRKFVTHQNAAHQGTMRSVGPQKASSEVSSVINYTIN